MLNEYETRISSMRVRERKVLATEPAEEPAVVEVTDMPKKSRGEAFVKNVSVAAALVLCAVTLRTGAIPALQPAADAVLTAATDQSLLDDQLGKLSFVSALFPEAVLVFGESKIDTLAMPVSGGVVVHAWNEAEPYMSWRTGSTSVTSSADGEVIGVYHGDGEEQLVQILNQDGLACLYGNLTEVMVKTGDAVSVGDLIGTLMQGQDFVLEVRRNGLSIDPAIYFSK